MIYLIITTSINNKYGLKNETERRARYLYSITESLKHIPHKIKPIIVENNGKRLTYLDNFTHYLEKVDVHYTDNNQLHFNSKGVNEFYDIKEVIEKYNIQDDDIIIKLTGRYRALSPDFFNNILHEESVYDAFIKFYDVSSLKFEEYDCVLGCFALRANYFKLFNPLIMNNYKSAEIAFARYLRFCGARINEIKKLDIECVFVEDNRVLIV
jgi:hypothetical protein